MRILVVLPTFNERDNVAAVLTAVREALPTGQMLVVDDGSPDGTADVVRDVAALVGNVHLLERPYKAGLGSAYRTAFGWALEHGFDVVVTMDVDFSHDPAVIPHMIRLIEAGADVVIGSRYVPDGSTAGWPLHRRLLSRWGNRYASFVLGLQVRDCTSGFRAYRSQAIKEINAESGTADGYAFLTELVHRLVHGHVRVIETPIEFRDRRHGSSKMSWRIVAESMGLVTVWGARDLLMRVQPRKPMWNRTRDLR